MGLSAAAGNNVYGGKITFLTKHSSGNTGSGYIGAYGQGFFATVLADGTENLRSAINYYSLPRLKVTVSALRQMEGTSN